MAEWWGEENESWKTGSEAKRARMAIYVEWLITAVSDREIPSKQKLADYLEITTQTLRNYSKDPHFQRLLAEEGRAMAKVDRIPDILNALYRAATDPQRPSSQAAKIYLDYVDKIAPPLEADVKVEAMSSEELAKLAVHVLEKQLTDAE